MDMKMADMKMSKSDKKKMMPTVAGPGSGPDYPWGLTLNLDSAALKKLGIKELPEAGAECMIHAVGKVTRISESASEKSEDRSIEVQITKLALMHDEDEHESLKKGYAKGKGPKAGM